MEKTKKVIQKYWDWRSTSFGHDADKSAAIASQWESIVTQWAGAASGRCALDIGTGTGQFAVYLARAGFSVTGIDISPAMVIRARQYAAEQQCAIDFQTGDAEALAFDDHQFDVVVSRNCLWTLPHPDRALSEWRRVLKPGGHLMVCDGLWKNTTWMRTHRLAYKLIKDLGVNGSRVSLRFFRAYAGIYKRLPFYEGLRLDAAVKLLQNARFKNIQPYDTSRLQVCPYPAKRTNQAPPPFFIAAATR
ncbi:methyltransferase, type 11 [Desulfosarcina variabilis str. Montpellier]|uniref:class I SAM-dependent methyltransferase n=1 Tax=Desulfosarcina variabilis TaxID=2300 RepID=UPI003AFAD4A2